jgi:hypothetical protein
MYAVYTGTVRLLSSQAPPDFHVGPCLTRQFHKRRQPLISMRNETLSITAMRVCNPDCSPFAINR